MCYLATANTGLPPAVISLHCLPGLPPQYIRRGWADDWTCAGFATLRYINAFAAWMALGFVAFSRLSIANKFLIKISSKYYIFILTRCLSLCAPELSKAVTMRRRNLGLVLLVWVYAVLLVLPSLLQLYGSFGYNRRLGKVGHHTIN